MRLIALIPTVGAALLAAKTLAQAPDGEALFATHCAACHVNPTEEKVPTRAAMAALSPNAIVEALTDGSMRIQGQPLVRGTAHRDRGALDRPTRARRVAVDRRGPVPRPSAPFAMAARGRPLERLGPRHPQHALPAEQRRDQRRQCGCTRAQVGVRRCRRDAVPRTTGRDRRLAVHGQPNGPDLRPRREDRLHALDVQGPVGRADGDLGRPAGLGRCADGLRALLRRRSGTRLRRRCKHGQGALDAQGRRASGRARHGLADALRRAPVRRDLGGLGGDRGRDAGLRMLHVPRQPDGTRCDHG